jgi:hypothetical protein
MADRRADRILRLALRGFAPALVASCCACASIGDPVGYAIVTQDRYDFMPCAEIIANRNGNISREKQLSELAAKAEASPGGFIASYAAYRSELAQVRTSLAAADRAARKNNCDLSKK